MIKRYEGGFVAKPYLCSRGFLTVGYGHNIEANPLPKEMSEYLRIHGEITQEMGERLFVSKFNEARSAAMGIIGPAWSDMNEVRQAVLVSMVFQMGIAGFRKFKNTIAAISARKWVRAAYNMLQSSWEDQTEQRAHQQALMMATGEWLVI